MNTGDNILLPSDTSLTAIGVKNEKIKGKHISLSKFKIGSIYWEEVYYPYPHSIKRIELKKGAGKTYIRYMESVDEILMEIN